MPAPVSPSSLPPQPPRKLGRSSIACKRCHASKIRCDVSINGSPCTRCRERSQTDCQPIESRRGLYDRKDWMRKLRNGNARSKSTNSSSTTSSSVNEIPMRGTAPVRSLSLDSGMQLSASTPTQPQLCFVLPDAKSLTSHNDFLQNLFAGAVNCPQSITTSQLLQSNSQNTQHISAIATSTATENGCSTKSYDSHKTSTRTSPEEPIRQWSVVFKCLVSDDEIDRNTISYFGDSFPMGGLLQSLSPPHSEASPRSRTGRISSEAIPDHHPSHMTPPKISYLESEGCFQKPPSEVLDQLLSIYFQNVHPLYPIIDRVGFAQMYKEDKCPWLLLHSICFVAVMYCPMSLVCSEDASTRREARMKFYWRAKSLFDFSYEKNKLVLLQSAILLSFWGGKPNDYWNTFSWINVAVNVAETLGIHKRRPSIEIPEEDRGLWKRIWSCLVSRDSFCAALLGKPLRINLLQCDADFTVLEDFESDVDPEGEQWSVRMIAHGMYVIAMTRLALILRHMLQARASNTVNVGFLCKIKEDLQNWSHDLPEQLRLSSRRKDSPQYIYCISVALIYSHHIIYAHQIASGIPGINEPEGLGYDKAVEFFSTTAIQEAVSQIADLGSSLVTHSEISRLPQNAYAAFFMAIVMLFTQMRNLAGGRNPTLMALLKTQLKICEMVIYQAQDHWDHADWIMALSESLRQRLDFMTRQGTVAGTAATGNTGAGLGEMEIEDRMLDGKTLVSSQAGIGAGLSSDFTSIAIPSMLSTEAELDEFMKSLQEGMNALDEEPSQLQQQISREQDDAQTVESMAVLMQAEHSNSSKVIVCSGVEMPKGAIRDVNDDGVEALFEV
ncbi:fungal-specific transcription factor domain-containing protein [Myxozyma melibiosi]|uniref:Fungal-specific transcription factor domain-containing protein n=1 Tax=Myxozyma melibiosi TaxID=54550 RepID=A0ABR1F2A5_9ASCO